MHFRDISTDTESVYRLTENEQIVFFMLNRSGDITFELAGPQAEAQVFAFFVGQGTEQATLNIAQKHLSPRTTSRVLVKSVLSDSAQFAYRGTLHISKEASLSDASQENRNLLLSKDAKAISEPALEILNHDVRCHHAATTSPLSREQLSFLQSRGLTPQAAEKLLVQGFLLASLETMGTFVSPKEQAAATASLEKILS